tara:strand:- start:17151 stop:17441 length:291 start_codon:yes stop_codon:yes gene_type:complete
MKKTTKYGKKLAKLLIEFTCKTNKLNAVMCSDLFEIYINQIFDENFKPSDKKNDFVDYLQNLYYNGEIDNVAYDILEVYHNQLWEDNWADRKRFTV